VQKREEFVILYKLYLCRMFWRGIKFIWFSRLIRQQAFSGLVAMLRIRTIAKLAGLLLKGPCHEIFNLRLFSSNNSICDPDTWVNSVIDTPDHKKIVFIVEYIREYEAISKKAYNRGSGAQMELFDEKNRRSKILWQGPFKGIVSRD
jgi:hypothetical protein